MNLDLLEGASLGAFTGLLASLPLIVIAPVLLPALPVVAFIIGGVIGMYVLRKPHAQPIPPPYARQQFLSLITAELDRAYAKHGKALWGRHEFYGILMEEVRELEAEIFKDAQREPLVEEMVQVAAMCLRYFETGNRYRDQVPDTLPIL